MKTLTYQLVICFFLSFFTQNIFAKEASQEEIKNDKDYLTALRVNSIEELEALSKNHTHPARLITIQMPEEMIEDLIKHCYDRSDESFIHRHSKGLLSNTIFYGSLGFIAGALIGTKDYIINNCDNFLNHRYWGPHRKLKLLAHSTVFCTLVGVAVGGGYYFLSHMLQTGIRITDNIVTLPEYALPELYKKMKRARDYDKLQADSQKPSKKNI